MKKFIWLGLFISGVLFAQDQVLTEIDVNKVASKTQYHFTKPVESNLLLFPTKIAIEDNHSQYFIIKVTINGQGPYQFMIDTGTSFTLFSQKVATELNLPHLKSQPFTVNGQAQNVDFYHVNELAIGEATIRNYDIIVFEEPSLISHFIKEKNVSIDGILGYGAFHEYILTLDFPKMQISLETNHLSLDDKDTVPYFHDRFVPIIPVIFKSAQQKSNVIHFVIDSGFSGFFFMPPIIPSMPFKTQEEKKKSVLTGLGVFDVLENVIEADAYFANQKVSSPEVMYGKEIYGKSSMLYGLMGLKIINQFSIRFDQKNYLIQIKNTDVQSEKVNPKPNVPYGSA